jgi:hypothetical protein
MPLLLGGGPPVITLAAGLAIVCLLLAVVPGGKPAVRSLLALGLAALGYGLTYATLAPRQEPRPPALEATSPAAIALSDRYQSSPTLGPDWAAVAGSTWSLIALTQCQQSLVAGTAAYQLGVAEMEIKASKPWLDRTRPDLDWIKDVNLGSLLAVAIDLDARAAVVLHEKGVVELCSYPDFRPRGYYLLEQPGYRVVLDGAGGRLYVAASDAGALRVNSYGDRPVGRGDIHVYDVQALLQAPVPGAPLSALGLLGSAHGQGPLLAALGMIPGRALLAWLRPQTVIPLGGDVSHLLLAPPEDKAIYYLLHRPEGDRVGRISTAAAAATGAVYRPKGRLEALCLAPDGKTLYAGGPGTVVALDPTSLRPRAEHHIDAAVRDLSADGKGRVFVAEQGQWPEITVLDGSSGAILKRWESLLPGRNYLAVMPDGGRVYVGSSGRISGLLRSLRVLQLGHAYPSTSAFASGEAMADQRGEFFLAPDMQRLITRAGKVFHLARPERERIVTKVIISAANPLIDTD